MRLYAESFSIRQRNMKLSSVQTEVPTGCARFKNDILHETDYQLRTKYVNLIHSTYNNGGHFIALQRPELLYKDFIEFVRKLKLED